MTTSEAAAVGEPAVVVHHRLHADFAVGFPLLRRLLGPRAGLELDATGPYRAVRVFGVRLSLADRGLTFGTTTRGGVCLRFREPVRGIDPWGWIRHPGLTVTVSEPELVAEAVNRIGAGS